MSFLHLFTLLPVFVAELTLYSASPCVGPQQTLHVIPANPGQLMYHIISIPARHCHLPGRLHDIEWLVAYAAVHRKLKRSIHEAPSVFQGFSSILCWFPKRGDPFVLTPAPGACDDTTHLGKSKKALADFDVHSLFLH